MTPETTSATPQAHEAQFAAWLASQGDSVTMQHSLEIAIGSNAEPGRPCGVQESRP